MSLTVQLFHTLELVCQTCFAIPTAVRVRVGPAQDCAPPADRPQQRAARHQRGRALPRRLAGLTGRPAPAARRRGPLTRAQRLVDLPRVRPHGQLSATALCARAVAYSHVQSRTVAYCHVLLRTLDSSFMCSCRRTGQFGVFAYSRERYKFSYAYSRVNWTLVPVCR